MPENRRVFFDSHCVLMTVEYFTLISGWIVVFYLIMRLKFAYFKNWRCKRLLRYR